MAGFDAGSLVSKLKLDKSGWNTSVRGVEQDTKKMGGFVKRNSAGFKKMGTTMTVAGGVIIGAFGAMVKQASDAEETTAKFGTVFQSVMPKAAKAAKDLSENYGLSTLASETLLSATGDLLTGLGLTGDTALDLSIQTQQLAVDLASFTNFSGGAEGASEALTKAMLGERESVKALGIVITEEMVKEELLKKGKEKLTGQALLQAKAEATIAIAMTQSTNAMGDYARTSGSLANQQRLMKARMNDLFVEIGTHLIPIVTKLVSKITAVVGKITEWMKEHPKLAATITKIIAGLGGMLVVLGPILIILPKIVAGISAMKFALVALTGPIGLVIAGLAALTIGYMKVKAAQDKAAESAANAAQSQKQQRETLIGIGEAAGMTVEEIDKLIKKYKGQTAALAMAIKHGKEGKELQDALTKSTTVQAIAVEELKEEQVRAQKAQEKLNAETEAATIAKEAAAAATKKWQERLKELGLATGAQEKRIEAIKNELKLLYEIQAKTGVSTWEYHKAVLALEKELAALTKGYSKASSLIGGMFTPSIVEAMKKLSSFKDEGEAAEWQILNIAKAANTTALAVKIAIHNMQADMAMMAGIYIPRISTAFLTSDGKIRESSRTTSKEVKSTWDQLTDGIQTKMASTWSAMLQGTTSFKDGFNGIINAIKSNFFDMIGSMIAKWTVNFIGSIVSSSASAATSITSKLGGAVDKIGEAATAAGSGLGASIVALAQGIATAAKIIASSAKEILIAAAVALAVYAGFSAIKKLFGAGGGKAMDATNRELHNIWIEARNSWQELMLIRDMSKEMMNSAWSSLDVAGITNSLLTTMADYLKTIAEALTRKGTIFVDVLRAAPIEEAVQKLGVITEKSLSGVQSSISEMSAKKIIGEILGPDGLRPTGLIGRKLVPEITGPGGIRGGGLIERKLVPEILGPGGIQPGIEPKRRRRRIFEPFIPPPEPRFEKNWGVLLKRMAGYLKTIAETLTGKKLKPSGLIGRKLVPEILGPGGIQPGGLTIGGEIPEILGPGLRRRKRGEPGGGEAKQVVIKIDMTNRFEISTLDPRSMRRIVHQEILPLIIESFDRPRIKTKIKEKMGI